MKKKSVPVLPTYLLGLILLFPVAVFGYTYFSIDFSRVAQNPVTSAAPSPVESVPVHIAAARLSTAAPTYLTTDDWKVIYPNTLPMAIQDIPVQASLAKTWPERISGLSGTPYLPRDVVKVFVFETDSFHSIWMKDMQYAIDIIWVDANNTIVDFVKGATPESFPTSFVPEIPARYVIETAAGFIDEHQITVGGEVLFPEGV